MSVINKMLRDLDSRQAAQAAQVQAQAARTGLTRGTDVTPLAAPVRRLGRALALAGLLLLGAAAAWWGLRREAAAPVAAPVTPPAALAAATPAAIAASVAPPRAAPLPERKAQPVVVQLVARTAVAPTPAAASVKAAAFAPVSAPASAAAPMPIAPTLRVASVEAAPKAASPAAASVDSTTALMQALAQGQSLWNSGAHEAAMDLLRDALALAQRSAAGSATPPLAALARELARMEMAQGQVAAAAALLARLEPELRADADVWALRGSAAQRLGRHEESAAAYLAALRLRPNEARWMLGAAVALAAQGQTASALEWAQKAQALGALSPEVASYLRQLGVALPQP